MIVFFNPPPPGSATSYTLILLDESWLSAGFVPELLFHCHNIFVLICL